MLTSLVAVAAVGLLLFAVSGVWPPMVAVESGSMEPHMQKGDLIFITEPGRFTSDAAYGETGVVTAVDGERADYRTFGGYGSVVVYDNPARYGSPVIHRAHFWVDDGENWYDRANPDYISADDCGELTHCPAPNAGFITKGDANGRYDQANGISRPVKPSWITGVARVRVPYLGWIRLGIAQTVLAQPAPADAVGVAPNATAESSVATDANGTTDVTPDVATNVTPDVATNVTPDDVAPTPTPTPGVPAVRPTDARRPPVDPTGTPSSATAAA